MKWTTLARTAVFVFAVAWIAYVWTHPAYPPDSDRAYVRAVYRAVLNREPDATDFRTNYKELKKGKVTRVQMLKMLLCSPEFQKEHPDDRDLCAR